jgi:hypothetical protein
VGLGDAFAIQTLSCGIQQRRSWGYAPSFSAQVRWGEPGAPVQFYWVLLGHRHFSSSCGVQHEMLVQRAKKSPGAEAQILLDVYGPTKVVP